MRRLHFLSGAAAAILFVLVACGNDERKAFEADEATSRSDPTAPSTAQDAGNRDAATTLGKGKPGVGYPDGGCSPLTCKTGCCTPEGTCKEGTTAGLCGKGGLLCVDCSAMGFGCVDQGCNAAATCPGCDGCCKAGTCNAYGKTQDDACGRGGALCKDCTSSGQSCDGNGSCR
jgi:hypothetical protein